jgi:hypothetical protein
MRARLCSGLATRELMVVFCRAKEDAEHVDQAEHKFAAAALMQLFAASLADPVPCALSKSTKTASSRSTHSAAESDARRGGRKRKPSAK